MDPAAPAAMQIVANEPMARLRVGDRVVRLEVPIERVAAAVPEEDAGSLVVEAFTADGRKATAVAALGARTVELEFRRPRRPRAPSSEASVVRAASGEQPLPLSPSPYGSGR